MGDFFAEKGYMASMSDVAGKAGIKVQTIYSHFESKDEIIWECISEEIKGLFQVVEEIIDSCDNLSCEKKLEKLFFNVLEYLKDLRKLRILRNIALIQKSSLKNQCLYKMRNLENEMGSKLGYIIQDGIKKEEIKPLEPEGIIFLFISMMQGILEGFLFWGEYPFEMDSLIKKTWDTYWQGIKA